MKKLNLIAASIIIIMACNSKEQNNNTKAPNEAKNTITIKGSDTVLPLSQKEAEAYMKEHPETAITIVGGGSKCWHFFTVRANNRYSYVIATSENG